MSSQEQTSDFCLSYQGPDQGYAFRLARLFEKRLCLADKEKQTDVVAGCVALALKRASLLGRAPMIGDLQKAFDLFGFLSTNASRELITRRQKIFAGASNHGCDRILRDLVDLVPASSLGLSDVDHPVAEL